MRATRSADARANRGDLSKSTPENATKSLEGELQPSEGTGWALAGVAFRMQ
jgi:hypothetical protein